MAWAPVVIVGFGFFEMFDPPIAGTALGVSFLAMSGATTVWGAVADRQLVRRNRYAQFAFVWCWWFLLFWPLLVAAIATRTRFPGAPTVCGILAAAPLLLVARRWRARGWQ